ncbi:hypothetical protein ACF0H5_019560 [Mactra antiquata]
MHQTTLTMLLCKLLEIEFEVSEYNYIIDILILFNCLLQLNFPDVVALPDVVTGENVQHSEFCGLFLTAVHVFIHYVGITITSLENDEPRRSRGYKEHH